MRAAKLQEEIDFVTEQMHCLNLIPLNEIFSIHVNCRNGSAAKIT